MRTDAQDAQDATIDAGGGVLLYRFEATLDVNVVGLVPEGLLMSNPFEGRVTAGSFMGARVWGTDPFLLRRDGVGVVDVPKTISGDGFHIAEHVRAYALPPEGLELPPLEALLAPGFQWPDVDFPIHGSSTFRAAASDLTWLNRAVARVDGTANMATGALVIETRILDYRPPAAGIGTEAAGGRQLTVAAG
ncbi:MAG TPA: hypothetical protein VK858_00025 [Longimicrobiales bacterium]|nr:hypothetical protein [Longimicrobiales bacterium]